jgi:hypothetical protein
LGGDGLLYASDGTPVATGVPPGTNGEYGNAGGLVHVSGYVRYVNGKPVEVRAYERSKPEYDPETDTWFDPETGQPLPGTTLMPFRPENEGRPVPLAESGEDDGGHAFAPGGDGLDGLGFGDMGFGDLFAGLRGPVVMADDDDGEPVGGGDGWSMSGEGDEEDGGEGGDESEEPEPPDWSPEDGAAIEPDMADPQQVRETVGPPTNEHVNLDEMYGKLGFDPEGKKEWDTFYEHPVEGVRGQFMAWEAEKIADKEYEDNASQLGNGEGDAFRHALWSYMMAKDLGEEPAKAFGDAHERQRLDSEGARLMDLYNNAVGRELARDPANRERPHAEVIREAVARGDLQLQPFRIYMPPSFGKTEYQGGIYGR